MSFWRIVYIKRECVCVGGVLLTATRRNRQHWQIDMWQLCHRAATHAVFEGNVFLCKMAIQKLCARMCSLENRVFWNAVYSRYVQHFVSMASAYTFAEEQRLIMTYNSVDVTPSMIHFGVKRNFVDLFGVNQFVFAIVSYKRRRKGRHCIITKSWSSSQERETCSATYWDTSVQWYSMHY